jgi:hypothetical protein
MSLNQQDNNDDKEERKTNNTQLPPATGARRKSSTAGDGGGESVHKNGVRLKKFEQVVTKLLSTTEPSYSKLPPAPRSSSSSEEIQTKESSSKQSSTQLLKWPWNVLPAASRLQGHAPGQLVSAPRAARKEAQLSCILRCVQRLVGGKNHQSAMKLSSGDRPFTIVDFGGGSGHLGIPLAILFPRFRIIVVDLRKHSLDLMHEKAIDVAKEWNPPSSEASSDNTNHQLDFLKTDDRFRQCPGSLNNLFSFHGPVENFTEPFDMALALHLCGEATDVTLRRAGECKAAAIVVAPCCVGKLSNDRKNPDVYNATGANTPTVKYPQSSIFCQLITQQTEWDVLVKAADYSDTCQIRTKRNASRRAAKALLETDRRLFLEEQFGYKTSLMRMEPWEVTPKNDILVAWDPSSPKVNGFDGAPPDPECQADVVYAKEHLLLEPISSTTSNNSTQEESVDWSKDEETEISTTIQEFLDATEGMPTKMEEVFVFPTRMGGRRRKLIHFVAGRYDLAHWSQGEKDGEKTVAVARRGRRSTKNHQ